MISTLRIQLIYLLLKYNELKVKYFAFNLFLIYLINQCLYIVCYSYFLRGS